MFKKALQVATAFGLLLAGYAGYVRVFALVVSSLSETRRGVVEFAKEDSKTVVKAKTLAAKAFGAGHWAAAEDLQIRIYNAKDGFWMYAKNYKRLNEGKQLEFTPFAIIWASQDGKSLKTATSDSATIDLDQPLGLIAKPGSNSSQRVVHARMEGEVRLRDDKGTPSPRDDLNIGPMTYVEYDEPTLQIMSESDVTIEDSVYRITGQGLEIKLRPRDAVPGAVANSTGFNGAQTAFLKRNVHIVVTDVGPSGILPGNSSAVAKPSEKTPLDLRCDSLMQIDLPKPRLQPLVGPPAPSGPTVAQFFRNVEVKRGKPGAAPDELYCDHLRLTLVPGDKPKPKVETSDSEEEELEELETGGSNLTLKRADASGHNVRLVSAGQGVKARCNELIHKKNLPEAPDETYFRGDATTRLIVEKTDLATQGPNKGKVSSFTTIRTVDATIFDDGMGNDNATIVARGPGELESRPGIDKPVEHRAKWFDQLTLQPDKPATAKAAPGVVAAAVTKRLTLTGRPSFEDLSKQTSLDSRQPLVVWLKPKAPAPASPTSTEKTESSSFDLEKLVALGDVHLKSPGKVLTARDRLDAEFETEAPAPAAKPLTAPVASTSTPPTEPKPAAEAPAKPVELASNAIADRVYAKVRLKPADPSAPVSPTAAPSLIGGAGASEGRQSEIDTVYLRGNVAIHQDPAAGKTKGTDISGQAIDMINQGDGNTRFTVFNHVPKPRGKNDPPTPPVDLRAPLAKVETEDMTIRGQVIGLDQRTDQAWVEGRGSLMQMASAGLLSDKSPDADSAAPEDGKPQAGAVMGPPKPARKTPMSIKFNDGMKFFGQSTDPKNRTVARAEFYKDVHAETEDASLDCTKVMRTYFDRTIKLVRPARDPLAAADPDKPKEPEAEIAIIECVENVEVVNRKVDPVTKALLQKQRIVGDSLVYEKATGKFRVPGEGQVYLYDRKGQAGANPPGPKLGLRDGEGDILLASDPAPSRGPRRAPPVVGSNSVRKPGDAVGANNIRALGANPGPGVDKNKPLPDLVLTEIFFTRGMHGRFGSGKDSDKTETRWADFFGDVQAHSAVVPDGDTILDPDKLPRDAKSITSQVLRVVSEPQPRTPDAPPRYLLRAWENAYAVIEDKTIQADTITYDSLYDLFYAYGEDGRDVAIAQQAQLGQPASVTQGRAAMFNAKSGQSQLIEPKSVAFVDARTGYRPTAAKPPDETLKPRRQDRVKFRNPRNAVERKSFNGS